MKATGGHAGEGVPSGDHLGTPSPQDAQTGLQNASHEVILAFAHPDFLTAGQRAVLACLTPGNPAAVHWHTDDALRTIYNERRKREHWPQQYGSSVRSRRAELAALGLVMEGEPIRPKNSRRRLKRWAVSPLGRAVHEAIKERTP